MRVAHECASLVLEPSGAVALAAAIFQKLPQRGERVGIIVSGGNVDQDVFQRLVGDAQ